MRRGHDLAGAETVGAIVLFGLFIATIAFLNVTAVPQAGLTAEEEHFLATLSDLNGLQAGAEAAALPGNEGATVAQAVLLGPAQTAGTDFFSFFLATPAKASGEIAYEAGYGSVHVFHEEASAGRIDDVGSASSPLPLGRVVFDPHPAFRRPGVVSLENGGIVTTEGEGATLRYAPPVTVAAQADGVVSLTIKTRILNGTSASQGGGGPARLSLATEAATLATPAAPNAMSVTLRLETEHGSAWGSYLNASSRSAGLSAGASYTTNVARGAGAGGADVVTWRVDGTGAGNDIRFTHALAILSVRLS